MRLVCLLVFLLLSNFFNFMDLVLILNCIGISKQHKILIEVQIL